MEFRFTISIEDNFVDPSGLFGFYSKGKVSPDEESEMPAPTRGVTRLYLTSAGGIEERGPLARK